MVKQFLISQMIEDDHGVEKEQFYTITSENDFKYIGDTLDWAKAFDGSVLDRIRNDQYKQLRKGRLYVNNSELEYARITCTEGYVRNTTDAQAIHTAYNKLTQIGVNNSVISPYTYYKYGVSYSFTTNNIDDGYYKVIKDVDIPADTTLVTGAFPSVLSCTAGCESIIGAKNGSVEIDAEEENIIWLKHNTSTFDKISGITVSLKSGCKLPVNLEFQIYKNNQWETVYTNKLSTIKTHEERFYDNNYTTKEVRWVFKYDPSEEHNTSTKLILSTLNIVGSRNGAKLQLCKLEDLRHEDMISKTDSDMRKDNNNGSLDDIMRHYNDKFYKRKMTGGVVNWIISHKTATSNSASQSYSAGINMLNKANTAPYLQNIIASSKGVDGYTHIHKEDVIVSFDIKDDEEDTVGYNVYIDEVNDKGKIMQVNGLESNTNRSVVIENKYFKKMNDAGSAYTTLYITPFDSIGMVGNSYPIYVYKQNRLPTILSTMFENNFTVTVTDPDNDHVSCKLFINDFEFGEFSLKESPAVHSFIVPSTKVKIGVENTIKMVASDDMPGEARTVTAEHKFIGAHYGLLFADEDETILTSEFDDIFKKIDFGTIVAGNTSFAQKIKLLNKTGIGLSNILIKSTINDNPVEEYKIEFDTDEDFGNPKQSLMVETLPNGAKYPFYVRVSSKSISATPQSAEFDVTGESNY
jgi:hypothetical protein